MNIRRMATCLALAVAACAGTARAVDLTINSPSTSSCNGTSTLTVTIDSTNSAGDIAGGQFFITWDSRLAFQSATAGPGLQMLYNNANGGGRDIAVNIPFDNTGSPRGNQTLVTITFTVTGADACNLASLVSFRPTPISSPPSTVTDSMGADLGAALHNLGAVTIDRIPPSVVCPGDITVECNASTAPSSTGTPTASDSCGTPTVTYSDLSPTFVSPGNLNGWSYFSGGGCTNVPGGDGTVTFVVGPASPPVGTGSIRLFTGTDGTNLPQIRNDQYAHTPLSSLTALGYSTYGTSWNGGLGGGQMTYMVLYIDLDGDDVYDDRLFFEPEYSRSGYGNPFNASPQAAPTLGVWQTWDALHGMWYNDAGDFGPGADARPLSMYLALYPTARIVNQSAILGGIRIAAGCASPGDVFDVNVDNFRIATAAHTDLFNFDPNAFPCVDNIISRTWKATDCAGNFSTCTQTITQHDSQAPSIVCPPAITVNADAGLCTARVNNNGFDAPLTLSNSAAPGVWYVDRYAPAGFAQASFLNGTRLKHSISSADSAANRPISYSSIFYNTQGRSLDIDLPANEELSIDLYIPSSWQTSVRRADIWGVNYDASNAISAYSIIGFVSNDPTNDLSPNPANPTPRWRVWDDANGWVNLATPVTYNTWHRLSITLNATSFVYKIDGAVVATLPNLGSVRTAATLIQAYNFGESYDVYWDNLYSGTTRATASDNCSTPTISYARGDNAALTFADPFPSGSTNVTWTATDCAGNSSSCVQVVTVNSVNTVRATVQVEGLSAACTRCVQFDLLTAGCAFDAGASVPVSFNAGGIGSATFTVPCNNVYTAAMATDTKHTLRRTGTAAANFGIDGAAYYVDLTSATGKLLLSGNADNNAYVDILDFGAYIGQFGSNLGANTSCTYSGRHTDFSGNGIVGIEDFNLLSPHFLSFRDPDPCGSPIMTGNDPGPLASIPVTDPRAAGMLSADVNHDGMIDAADVNAVLFNGVTTCAADFNGDRAATAQDIFDFLGAWFNSHPAADVNRSGAVNVQDIFDFLAVWFQGC